MSAITSTRRQHHRCLPETRKATELSKLQRIYDNLQILCLDVDNEESVQNCFDQLNQSCEKIDKIFNNAGIIDWRNIHTVSADAFSQVLQTNLRGAFLVLGIAFLACKDHQIHGCTICHQGLGLLNSAGSLGLVEQLRISAPRRL